ncbi:DNA replication/repair protein RecF [endosymbiont of unidentified scaly snail isolate Monju]|uniref:DNA replication/repair protein RecF n=1 Tax=endosymbiont of unidentified scaly snail isolate Monju TaxID=1248727 RepID=UPI0003891EF8|nr:DNA replication/repair protein RecF [endosymbiont of unidentified scaly snail isolate Monju]BAN67999.1 DNA replication and repair protein RecF [endosymbiont of unidentified scaly snail isolate Monju]
MFSELSIRDLRIIRDLRLAFSPGINLVIGPNGAGKTSVIEALYLLSVGRSFRHREPAPLIREGAEAAQVFARFQDPGGVPHALGMRRERQQLVVRLDGRSSVRRSEVLRLLPVQFIGPDPQQMVQGPPEYRRQVLDTGLFHVEPEYLSLMQRYSRALQQRNAALRQGGVLAPQWDHALGEAGTAIDTIRRSYVERVITGTEARLADWKLNLSVSFHYRSGWRAGFSLQESLEAHREIDARQGYMGVGPHRADLVIDTNAGRGGKVLSRGQLKMLVAALMIAQAEIHRERLGRAPVLLFDDLPAELDRANRDKLLAGLGSVYPQMVVTSLELDGLGALDEARVFHVEQGVLSRPAVG